MGRKKLGSICFLIADLSEKSKEVIKLVNQFAEIIPGSIFIIVSDDNLKAAQTCFSDKIKLYNVSMCETKNGKSVAKALLSIANPEMLLVLSTDNRALSFAKYSRLNAQILFFGNKLTINKEIVEAIDDEKKTVSFIIQNIEQDRALDFYPKCPAHAKALKAEMETSELLDAIFHRNRRVEADFLSAWGYSLPASPRTYNEKLNFFKTKRKCRSYRSYADKYKARHLIKKMGYEELLPECYVVVDTYIKPQVWNRLPDKFIIKSSNASGYNILIDDKSTFELDIINRVLKSFKRVKYGLLKNEPVYSFNGKILCTEFIENLTDYKFFCFNGEVKFVAVVKEWLRESNYKEPYQIIFDRDFNELPFSYGYERGTVKYDQPQYFEKMLEIVEKLSKGIPHVRIDMMGNAERFYFGEFTFFPGGGRDRFNPSEYDLIVGDYIK